MNGHSPVLHLSNGLGVKRTGVSIPFYGVEGRNGGVGGEGRDGKGREIRSETAGRISIMDRLGLRGIIALPGRVRT